MKSRLSRSGVAVAIGVSVALAGCSAGGSMSEGTGGGGSASAAPVAWNEPTADLSGVTLTFGGGSVGGALDKVIKDFEAATKVKIKRTVYPDPYEQNLLTKVATGDKPDLASWQPTASSLAALQAPTNLLPLEGAPWLESLDPGLRDITGFFDKTRYAALVTTPSVMGVYYNKAAFTKAGVTELPKSWAELIAAADAIKAEGQVPFHEAGGAKWPTQWWVQVPLAEAAKAGLWEEVNTNEQQFTSPAIQAAITDYKGLIDKGYFNKDIKTATFEEQAEAVYSGKAAMSVQVDALLLQMQTTHSATEIDKAVGWFPISKDGNIA
ncbi:MAG TPA: extracellular solute-binding protein, partial [Actinomycetales bacterium]